MTNGRAHTDIVTHFTAWFKHCLREIRKKSSLCTVGINQLVEYFALGSIMEVIFVLQKFSSLEYLLYKLINLIF